MSNPPKDDRWEWVNVRTMSDPDDVWIRGACRHKFQEPVYAIFSEPVLVAQLCLDCGRQLKVLYGDGS